MADDWRGILYFVEMFTKLQVYEMLLTCTALRLVRLGADQRLKNVSTGTGNVNAC